MKIGPVHPWQTARYSAQVIGESGGGGRVAGTHHAEQSLLAAVPSREGRAAGGDDGLPAVDKRATEGPCLGVLQCQSPSQSPPHGPRVAPGLCLHLLLALELTLSPRCQGHTNHSLGLTIARSLPWGCVPFSSVLYGDMVSETDTLRVPAVQKGWPQESPLP